MAFFWLWPGPNHPLKTSENGCFLLGFLPHFCYFFIRLLGCFVPYFLFFFNSFLSSLFILFYQFFYPLTRCFLLWIEVFFLEIQDYFFLRWGRLKSKNYSLIFRIFWMLFCSFFTLRLHNFWVFFSLFLSSIFRLMMMNFHHHFWLFFSWFFLAWCYSFFKIRCWLFCFLFVYLYLCLVNIHAVNDCCACVAVPLNRDRCSFFFLFLSASPCFSLRDLLRMESIFLAVFLFFL
jgi:hypothetical protein